jgi:peptide/nickel transport system ATP-binding protein
MALLEIEALTVEIPADRGLASILTDVDLVIDAGESVGLVGESGSGKSMTALAVMGLLPEAARVRGAVRLDGENLLAMPERDLCRVRGRRVAMVFQEPMTALNPVRTIGDQVAEGLRLHFALSGAEALDRAARLLDRVGLPQARFPLSLYPHQLSGGQRQRVVIALALACGPQLLIADEPTTALDVTIQSQILDLIVEVTAEVGMALLMISHDLGVIAETTDRMAVMYAGRIVETGPTAAVFADMAHPYTAGLFAAVAHEAEHGRRSRLATIPGTVPDPLAYGPGCRFAPRCPRATAACVERVPPTFAAGPGHGADCIHPLGRER